jgi:hypothetical protein
MESITLTILASDRDWIRDRTLETLNRNDTEKTTSCAWNLFNQVLTNRTRSRKQNRRLKRVDQAEPSPLTKIWLVFQTDTALKSRSWRARYISQGHQDDGQTALKHAKYIDLHRMSIVSFSSPFVLHEESGLKT